MLKTLVLLIALALPASAQTFLVGGMLTDSSSTVTTPTPPAWATKVRLDYQHRARFEWGRETDFINYQGQCSCDFFVDGYVGQEVSLLTNGVKVSGGRTKLAFAEYGVCVTFDGTYDWMGSSGNGSGLVLKSTTLTSTLNLVDLGPTVTVDADGTTSFAFAVVCTGTGEWDCYGAVTNYTYSWWDGQLTFTWIP